MKTKTLFGAVLAWGIAVSANAADVSQDAIDACIDQLRAQSSGGGGTVLSTEFSEANSLVMLRDAGGGVWRCLVGNAGSSAYLERDVASVSAAEPSTETEIVRFGSGRTGTDLSGELTPGSSRRYVLSARDGQELSVEFWTTDPSIEYQIVLPNGSFLLDMMRNAQPYRGSLFMNGDHVIEVINRGNSSASFNMSVEIR